MNTREHSPRRGVIRQRQIDALIERNLLDRVMYWLSGPVCNGMPSTEAMARSAAYAVVSIANYVGGGDPDEGRRFLDRFRELLAEETDSREVQSGPQYTLKHTLTVDWSPPNRRVCRGVCSCGKWVYKNFRTDDERQVDTEGRIRQAHAAHIEERAS